MQAWWAAPIGRAVGALIRRTVPAMAVTLAIFAVVQIAMPLWIRPNLFPAEHTVIPVACTGQLGNDVGTFLGCLASHGIREAISYQPASRYWAFQWTETAIYLVLALGMAGYCFRRVSRRLS